MPLMNRLNARAVATLGAGKYNDGALRDVSLKQARETATRWRSVFREGRAPIKKREK